MNRTVKMVYGRYKRKRKKPVIIGVLILSILAFMIISTNSYSENGYTITHYPNDDNLEFRICIEGEGKPSDQEFRINDKADEFITKNPYLIINGNKKTVNEILDGNSRIVVADLLELGCNEIIIGAENNSEYTIDIRYTPYWKTVITSISTINLKSYSEQARIKINPSDITYKATSLRTQIRLIDITKIGKWNTIMDETFEGLEKELFLTSGKYIIETRIYDGNGWSDTYTGNLTVTVEKKTMRIPLTKKIADSITYNRWDKWIPLPIKGDDYNIVKKSKRLYNGMYVVIWKILNYSL